MIRYDLLCSNGHAFDGWFGSISGFDDQVARGLVACPHCGDTAVKRALMAPAVATARAKEARQAAAPAQARTPDGAPATSDVSAPPVPAMPVPAAMPPAAQEALAVMASDPRVQDLVHKLREVKEKVLATADNVGDAFPEEARKIHYGEADARGIYGRATAEDAEELLEEGIAVLPLPVLPEDRN